MTATVTAAVNVNVIANFYSATHHGATVRHVPPPTMSAHSNPPTPQSTRRLRTSSLLKSLLFPPMLHRHFMLHDHATQDNHRTTSLHPSSKDSQTTNTAVLSCPPCHVMVLNFLMMISGAAGGRSPKEHSQAVVGESLEGSNRPCQLGHAPEVVLHFVPPCSASADSHSISCVASGTTCSDLVRWSPLEGPFSYVLKPSCVA